MDHNPSQSQEQWFLIKNKEQFGPYSWQQVLQMAVNGQIRPTDSLRSSGQQEWSYAAQYPELYHAAEQYQQQLTNVQASPTPVIEAQPKPPPAPPKKKYRTCGVIGGLLALLLSIACLIAVAITILSDLYPDLDLLPNLSFTNSQTPENQSFGTFTISPEGSSFNHPEIILQAPAGTTNTSQDFRITKLENTIPLQEGLYYRSDYYFMEGDLTQINGILQIAFPASQEALTPPAAYQGQETGLFISLEEITYTRDTGYLVTSLDYPAAYDAETNLIYTTIDLKQNRYGQNMSPLLARLIDQGQMNQTESESHIVAVSVSSGLLYTYYTSDHFQLKFRDVDPAIDSEAASTLLQILETQRSRLENDLGYNFKDTNITTVTLDNYVTLKSEWNRLMYNEEPAHKWGQQTPNSIDETASTLSFNKRYFHDPEVFNSVYNDILVTAGHELFHIVQFLYDPRLAYFKAKNPLPSLWFDEAASVWYEAYAVDPLSGNYLSPVADQYSDFIKTPLLSPSQDPTTIQNHGYGASLFLRYLTNKHGADLIRSTYEHYQRGTTSGNISEALVTALNEHNSSPAIEWIPFLETYYTNPTTIIPTFNGPNEPNTAILNAAASPDGSDYLINFTPNSALQAYPIQSQQGELMNNIGATLQTTFTLADLTADTLNISIDSAADSQTVFSTPGHLLIDVEAPENCGVLVYGKQDRGGTASPIAPAPWSYLSSQDPFTDSGRSADVLIDLSASQDSYKYIQLIAFNSHFSYTAEPQSQNISITLTYLPGTVTPPQTTTETQPNTDQIDMKQILSTLAQQRNWQNLSQTYDENCFNIYETSFDTDTNYTCSYISAIDYNPTNESTSLTALTKNVTTQTEDGYVSCSVLNTFDIRAEKNMFNVTNFDQDFHGSPAVSDNLEDGGQYLEWTQTDPAGNRWVFMVTHEVHYWADLCPSVQAVEDHQALSEALYNLLQTYGFQ